MLFPTRILLAVAGVSLALAVQGHEQSAAKKRNQAPAIEEVKIWGQARKSTSADYTNPTSLLTQEDLVAINATTTEDLVKYEPSLVIRKRYIGDSNGTLGMRGSNMFATPRSMVFADGAPLHYLLQTRWSGAPRWTMVSASEIAQVEILYGPFSAEYSGNAMGGVVLIETAIPQQRQLHVALDYFSQEAQAYGFNERVNGHKTFISAGDKFGDLSLYLSYNRLENDSQPQSYYYDYRTPPANGALVVNGALLEQDVNGKPAYYFGDTGIEQAVTDNFKIKMGYDLNSQWSTLLNIAFEDRNTLRDSPNSYLRDTDGDTLWSGNFVQDGIGMNVPAGRLGVSELDRQSLSVGWRVKGQLSEQIQLETNISDFRIVKDNSRASSRNPQDPLFNGSGQTTDYDDTGWQTFDAKLALNNVGLGGMEWIAGLRREAYELHLDQYSSDNWARGDNAAYTSRSGGETAINAAFVQMNWDINPRWDMALGGRYEHWQSQNGYFTRSAVPNLLVAVDDNSSKQFSPKFSLGFTPVEQWLLRYSLARAYRFPIVEELFSQSQSYSNTTIPRPDLNPENGLHHNLMLEKQFSSGYARINLFSETIEDAIESQTNYATLVTTFMAVDEVQTDGVELVLNYIGLVLPELDIRFNLAYTKSIIEDNTTAEGENASVSLEGNDYPRMPRWRSNLMLTYHASDKWDVSTSLQYAAKSFGRLQNDDTAENVMGAQDGYTLWGAKTTYDLNNNLELSLGVDNISDELNFVAHPWPRRTVFVGLSYQY